MRALLKLSVALSLLVSPLAFAQGEEEEAGDVSEIDKDALGPLRERVRPVSGHLFRKAGRFEISPGATVSMKDAFFTKYVFGLSLTYHPFETFGVGLRAGYSLPVVSGAAQICTTDEAGGNRGCRLPTSEEIDGRAPGQISLLAGIDLQWSPIYGKVSLISERFLHFDMYGIVGGSMVQYKGPSLTGGGASETTVGGNVGVGMRFVVNRFVAVRAEVRDLIYMENVIIPAQTSILRNQLLFEVGVSFFLPTAFGEG